MSLSRADARRLFARRQSEQPMLAGTVYVRPAERSHVSGPNVLISASLVVAFVETVPAALRLTLGLARGWLRLGWSGALA